VLSAKRLISTTLLGLLFGIVCWRLAASSGPSVWYLAVGIILSRTVMGFAIGISAWKIWWGLHGILMGIVFSLPAGFSALGKGASIFWWTIILGAVYGFLIELLTTKVLKAPMAAGEA